MTERLEMTDEQTPSRSLDLLGVVAVLCLAVFPDIYNAFVAQFWKSEGLSDFRYPTTGLIVRSIQVSVPLLLIVKLSKIEWESLGIKRIRWGYDTLAAFVVWLAGIIGYLVACFIVYVSLPETVFTPKESVFAFEGLERNGYDYALLVVASCANGFAEEFVMRGYLLTRIERLLNSTWAALLITTVLFAAYHVYQGVGAAIGIVGIGLVYGAAFCKWRRLWPLAIAHAIADFVGILTV